LAVGVILSIGFRLNLLLGIFNILPFPPFDGFGVLGLFTGNFAPLESLRVRMRQFSIIGLLIGWQAMNVLYPPALRLAERILTAG